MISFQITRILPGSKPAYSLLCLLQSILLWQRANRRNFICLASKPPNDFALRFYECEPPPVPVRVEDVQDKLQFRRTAFPVAYSIEQATPIKLGMLGKLNRFQVICNPGGARIKPRFLLNKIEHPVREFFRLR